MICVRVGKISSLARNSLLMVKRKATDTDPQTPLAHLAFLPAQEPGSRPAGQAGTGSPGAPQPPSSRFILFKAEGAA